MKTNIKNKVEEEIKNYSKEKKQVVSFTLSKGLIERIESESKRLEASKSFLVEMILSNYMELPILKDTKEEDNKS